MSIEAAPTPPPPPRRWLTGRVVAVSLVAVLGVALTQEQRAAFVVSRSNPEASASLSEPTSRADEASPPQDSGVPARHRHALRDVLRGQGSALARGDRSAYVSTWLQDRSGSRQQATATYANITALGLTDVQLRLLPGRVDAVAPSSSGSENSHVWTASVRFVSSLHQGSTPQRFDLTYIFAGDGASVRVQAIEAAAGGREPIWLRGRLAVIRTPRALVVGPDDYTVTTLSRQLKKASREVRAVIGPWPGELLLLAPRTVLQWERGLGVLPGDYDGLAAVTSTVDGHIGEEAPIVIALNPDIWLRLHERGISLVLAHEIAHAATGAVNVDTAAWIVEGFAEYVAFEAVPMPLRFSAGSALRDVRHNGLPHRLPTDLDFATSETRDVAYAQSWALCQTIAQQHGERALVNFYQAMIGRPNRLAATLHSVLGTTEQQLVQRWSADLRRLSVIRRPTSTKQ